MPVAELAQELTEVLDAAEHGESTVVLRQGKPVALIGPWPTTAKDPTVPVARRPGGLLAVVGLLTDWETLDDDMKQVVEARQHALDRPDPDID